MKNLIKKIISTIFSAHSGYWFLGTILIGTLVIEINKNLNKPKIPNNDIKIIKIYNINDSYKVKDHDLSKICIDNKLFLYSKYNLVQIFDDNNKVVKCDIDK